MIDRNEFRYVLIPYGASGATRLARIETNHYSTDGLRTLQGLGIRMVRRNGEPAVKNSRLIDPSQILCSFSGWPTTNQLRDAKEAIKAMRHR